MVWSAAHGDPTVAMEIPPWLWFRLPVGMAVAVRVGVFVGSKMVVRVGPDLA